MAGVAPAIALAQSGTDAAGDQYGTTPTTTATVGVTVTVAPTVTGSGSPGTTVPTPAPTTAAGGDRPTTGSGGDGSGVDPSADEGGSGAAPDADDGAGAPTGGGAPTTGTAVGGTTCSTKVAILTLGNEDDEAFDSVVKATGEPAYSADVRQRIPARGLFAGLDEASSATAFLRAAGQRFGAGLGEQTTVYLDGARVAMTDLEGELQKVGGVVLIASEPSGSLDDGERSRRTALLTGFVRGLLERRAACVLRAVAVETTDADPTQLALFQDLGLSTVDNVDERVGRQALLAVLAGYTGDFGRKDAADALLPTGPDGKPVRLSTASSIQEAGGAGGATLYIVLLMGLLTFAGLAVTADRRRRR